MWLFGSRSKDSKKNKYQPLQKDKRQEEMIHYELLYKQFKKDQKKAREAQLDAEVKKLHAEYKKQELFKEKKYGVKSLSEQNQLSTSLLRIR